MSGLEEQSRGCLTFCKHDKVILHALTCDNEVPLTLTKLILGQLVRDRIWAYHIQ